ncbi:MAG: hypothetical protein NC320_03695 [Clostridium sp.]|nr:hypothetical protein [Clostridium sp.]MCM1548315.1 hypothetical protein [Ruminococcus sp.]
MPNKIIEEIKKGLTGNVQDDIAYLQQQGNKYKDHPKASEILDVLSNMSFDMLPEENQKQIKEVMFIGEKRIDQIYGEAVDAINSRNIDKAAELLDKIEKKADETFSGENNFSFRNRLEEHIYTNIYNPTLKYQRTPFDFCQYLSAYGYTLVEKRDLTAAKEKLEKAIKYNPVNVEPRFELAEVYKLTFDFVNLFKCTCETLKICVTPYQIARCYTNLGYYCVEIKDYDSAVAFYYESLVYADNPAVKGELQHIRMLLNRTIEPPTREGVLAAFEKYSVPNGPSQDIINIAYSLGNYCIEHNAPPQESIFYMQLVYDLTHDKKVNETVDMLNAQIAAQKAAQETRGK